MFSNRESYDIFLLKDSDYMKKVVSLIVVILSCFFVTGCKGDITRTIRHSGFNLSSTDFVCNYFVSDDETGLYTRKMKFLGSNFVVDDNGQVYDISLAKLYSNNQNCFISDFSVPIVAMFDNSIGMGNDSKYYYMNSNNNVKAYSEVSISDNSYGLYDVLFKIPSVIKIVTVDQSLGVYYLLKNDGNVYKYVITRSDPQSPLTIVSSEVVYSKEEYGFITDFNYSNNAVNSTYILSDISFYRMVVSNKDSCNKYADVECVYDLKNDVDLLAQKDYISGYNGSLLITNYGKVFNVAS